MRYFIYSILSGLMLFILIPVLLFISILVLFFIGRPIIFKQKRPGKDGKPFTFYKFRTMTNKLSKEGDLLPDELRITKLGKYLRNTSIDELPSLFNVAIGNMSLVGPRPLLMNYLDKYSSSQNRRHEVRPGITGWAQINGRNNISWQEKFELDVWYVDNNSFFLDIKIIFITFWKVIKLEGISQKNHATMERFKGNER